MEIRLYFQMLRRGWWIIALTTLAAFAAALLASFIAVPQYKAVARFIIAPGTGLVNGSDVLNGLSTLDRQSVISTYAEVMNSSRVYTDALSSMKVQAKDVRAYKYEAVVLTTSSVLELSVSGPNPKTAADLANAIGYQAINFTRQLNQVYNVDFLDVAVPPTQPFSPNAPLNAALAILRGSIVGVALAILNEQLRTPLDAFRQRMQFDDMTGVYKHQYFTRLVDDELSHNPESVLSIGIVELNGLRDLVDTLPIISLQNILLGTTKILRNELRGNDIIGRWGENSYAIMLPNTSGAAAKGIFERILQALAHPIELDQLGATVDLDCHIGAAELASRVSTKELFERTGSALEQARRSGKNPVAVRAATV